MTAESGQPDRELVLWQAKLLRKVAREARDFARRFALDDEGQLRKSAEELDVIAAHKEYEADLLPHKYRWKK